MNPDQLVAMLHEVTHTTDTPQPPTALPYETPTT